MPSKRKRQTQITFNPLPSSSPATKGYNRQIQDRAAAVGYAGSPKKRRKVHEAENRNDNESTSAQLDGVNSELPTPAATMDGAGGVSSDVEEDGDGSVRPIQTRGETANGNTKGDGSKRRARQQRLDFSNVRDAESFDDPTTLPSSSTTTRSSAKAGMFGSSQRRVKKAKQPTEESEEDDLPQVEDVVTRSKRKRKRRGKGSGDEEDSDNASVRATRSSQRSGNGKASRILDSDDEDDEPIRPARSSQRPVVIESDDEHEPVASSPPAAPESGDEDDLPTTQGKQRRVRRQRQESPDSFIANQDSDDDLEIIEKPASSRRRRKRKPTPEEESGNSDPEPVTPGRRRKRSQQEQEDLDEDLDFLGPSSDHEALDRTPQTTQSRQKAARVSALEQLKRRRAKQPELVIPEEEEEEEDNDADQDDEILGQPDDEVDEDEVEEISRPPASSRQMFQEDEDDKGFVESENEDGELGVPEGIPIQFTKFARYKAKDLFKYAVEWMVHKKLNPDFDMDNELYNLTFQKLDDEVKGLAGSKFMSSVWTPDFTMGLRHRPEIAYEPFDRESAEGWNQDRCDACNRSGHPATFQVQFQGRPYHPHTLDDIPQRDDEGSDDDEDAASSNDEEDNGKPTNCPQNLS